MNAEQGNAGGKSNDLREICCTTKAQNLMHIHSGSTCCCPTRTSSATKREFHINSPEEAMDKKSSLSEVMSSSV